MASRLCEPPRADIDDDGDIGDSADQTAYNAKKNRWTYTYPPPMVSQVFSDVGNPYMFQGRPHFALAAGDWPPYPSGGLLLNDHRLRLSDPVTGRWLSRDPIGYDAGTMNLYEFIASSPTRGLDPLGLDGCDPDAATDAATDETPSWTDPDRPPWDPVHNECHAHCAYGRNAAVMQGGMGLPKSSSCINKCRAHCDKKTSEGFTASQQHAHEFWGWDDGCQNRAAAKETKHKVRPRPAPKPPRNPKPKRRFPLPTELFGPPIPNPLSELTELLCDDPMFEECRLECEALNEAIHNGNTQMGATLEPMGVNLINLCYCLRMHGYECPEEYP